MKYFSEFRNINETLYQIDFDVNNGVTGSTEILLSDEPFKVEYNGGDNIYEPLKLSNASCNLITTDIITDLFTSTAQGVRAKLTNKDTGKIEWIGYVTPAVYSQGWENEHEVLQVELIDGLSTLEYFEYQQVNTGKTTYVSFIDIIIKALNKSNCYTNLYVNKNLSVSGVTNYNNIIEKLYVNEKNFIEDEKNNTYKNILSDIAQFLNQTIIAVGDSVYMIDYNYIKNGSTNYTRYTTSNNWNSYTVSSTTLSHNYIVDASSFTKNGANISLTDTKNRASIEIKNNIITEIIPEVFDNELLSDFTNEGGEHSSYYTYTYSGSTYIMRWVRNEKIKDLHYYLNNGTYTPTEVTSYNSTKLKSANYVGGVLRQLASYKNDEIPSKLSFANYMTMKRYYSSQSVNKQELAMYQYTSDTDVALLYDNYYFLICFDANFDNQFNSYYPNETETQASGGELEVTNNALGLYIPAKLQIGNKFWNGTIWTTTDSKFNIKLDLKGSKKVFDKWYSVKNETFYYDELDGEGQKIPITKNDYLVGNPILTLYTPSFTTSTYSLFYGTIWIKDFKAELVKKENMLGFSKEETDTLYQNVINDEFVNEFDTMSLNINTDVNKGLCYSSILVKNDLNNYQLLSDITSTTNTTKKQEYNIIENIVELYDEPNKQLSLTLKNEFKPYSKISFMNENYLIDSYSIDYFNDNSELNIISIQ